MYFENATKQQLLQIALYEPCDTAYKYESCRELQLRRFHIDMLPDLIKLWGNGQSTSEISIELGVPQSAIRSQLRKYNLYGRRVSHVQSS